MLSRPVQAALWSTAVLTALALLSPEPAGVPVADAVARESTAPAVGDTATAADTPWVRVLEAAWLPPEAEPPATLAPLVAAPVPTPLPQPVAQALEPTAPEPAMRYLGRLEQDGRSRVFLGTGTGDDVQVVEIGGEIDGVWKLQKVTATQIELLYLPLNQTRFIAVP